MLRYLSDYEYILRMFTSQSEGSSLHGSFSSLYVVLFYEKLLKIKEALPRVRMLNNEDLFMITEKASYQL